MKCSELFLMTVLAALVVFGGQACDEEPFVSPNSTDVLDTDTNTNDAKLCGTVIGFGSDTPVPNMKVILLDNDTAELLAMPEQTSGSDGRLCISGLPEGKRVGLKVVGVPGQFVDTYQFNIRTDAQNEKIWIMSKSTFTASPKMAQVTVDPTKGIAAGGGYWLDKDRKEYPVECGTIEPLTGEADIRYFNDQGLPAPANLATSLNRANGYWVAANMTPGKVTLQLMVDGVAVGSTTFFAYPGEAISFGNIEVDPEYTENPGKCE
ncbi:MAG: hypothetical protein MUC50_05595 [Myxococcota bacterium]|nr:hypothetical protein [Myxococcota bacterium]